MEEKESEVAELEKELSEQGNVAELDYIEFMKKSLEGDGESFSIDIFEGSRVVVAKMLLDMSGEDFVDIKNLMKKDTDSFLESFSGLVKDMSDDFVGWDVVGVVHTNDGLPIGVIVNGSVLEIQ